MPKKPVEILNFATGNEASLMLQPRNLIIVEENAEVQIIERHQSLTSNEVLTNAVTEIYAADNAIIDYYKIQNDAAKASLIDNTYINQKSKSNVSVHTFSFGGNTIGQLDEDALFYMQTRGIPKKEARALLMYAFANNVLESVRIPELKARINKLIAKKLGVNLGFDL